MTCPDPPRDPVERAKVHASQEWDRRVAREMNEANRAADALPFGSARRENR